MWFVKILAAMLGSSDRWDDCIATILNYLLQGLLKVASSFQPPQMAVEGADSGADSQ